MNSKKMGSIPVGSSAYHVLSSSSVSPLDLSWNLLGKIATKSLATVVADNSPGPGSRETSVGNRWHEDKHA
jgi:hypothetical protein